MDRHLTFDTYLGTRIHLGVCGSVAAYRTLDVLRGLISCGAHVSATLTDSAARFVTPLAFESLGAAPVYGPMYPPGPDIYGHLEPAQNAHALVVAPATANILAKLANGLADDMLSCQALAMSGGGTSLVLAPAMNPRMWDAPATQANARTLVERGAVFVGPDAGNVACGETGSGRLADVRAIVLAALRAAGTQDMKGLRVLVNLGPTREFWDATRFLSNPSSGTMGAALAVGAWLRGAEVTAVCGPVDKWLPPGVTRVDVATAREMFDACNAAWPAADMAFLSAAVADYRPAEAHTGKLKRGAGGQTSLELAENPDIAAALGRAKKPGQILAGFAAEAADLESNAKAKLASKNLDLIAANPIAGPESAFGAAESRMLVLGADGRREEWPSLPKTELAWRLLDLAMEARCRD